MPGQVFIVGAVRGLVSEGERVFSIVQSKLPSVVGLSVSKEGMIAMKDAANPEIKGAGPANIEEEIYINWLSKFGEVIKPPPCFSMALKAADQSRIPVEPLDMDDEHYTAAYCKYISTLDMMRQGKSEKFYSKHVFQSKKPEDFVIEWDCLVNRLKGYRELEMAREEWLAKGACRLAKKHEKTLIVVELERLAGISGYLKTMECNFEVVY
jgi:hypothetical protein